MSGLLQILLNKRYGLPEVIESNTSLVNRWNVNNPSQMSVLYMGQVWDDQNRNRFGIYENLYGDAVGGFLVGDSLKVAMLSDQEFYGLYSIDELQVQPEIIKANTIEPDIYFFMDAANVWFYGLKGEKLYAYDSETMEFDIFDSIEEGLNELLSEWEAATSVS